MIDKMSWAVREPLSEAIGRLSSAEYSIALALAYDSPAVAIDSISTAREKITIALQLLDAAEALLAPPPPIATEPAAQPPRVINLMDALRGAVAAEASSGMEIKVVDSLAGDEAVRLVPRMTVSDALSLPPTPQEPATDFGDGT